MSPSSTEHIGTRSASATASTLASSSASHASSSTHAATPPHPTVVSHIRTLLPSKKHAVFHVKLVIHQLQSVPLMSGAFRVNWKFRHLQPVNSAGRPLGLGRALALKLDVQKRKRAEHRNGSSHAADKGKGKEVAHDEDDVQDEDDIHIHDISTLPSHIFPIPPDADRRPDSPHTRPQSKQSTSSSTSNSNSTSLSLLNFNSTATLNTPLSDPPSEDSPIDYHTDARGHTPYLPLRDFQVDFESEVNAAVQLSIERDTLALLPSELKLTVMQRVIHNDPEAPLNPRLGHVEINLAEYVGAGAVTRNYLLRRSKVNAMLNMTITMTQISGEENYRAPPLRKEEIKAGISDFLSASSVPLPSLSRYIIDDDDHDPWLSSALGEFVALHADGAAVTSPPLMDEPEEDPAAASPDATPDVPGGQARPKKRWRVGTANLKRAPAEGQSKTPELVLPKTGGGSGGGGRVSPSPSPSPSRSPSQKQQHQKETQQEALHPTEALIEAIFNPYPSSSNTVSPFTYYAPPAPEAERVPRGVGAGAGSWEGHGTDGTSRGSFDSSERASASASASEQGREGGSGSGSGSGGGSGHRWWQRRPGAGSRPVTPARVGVVERS